jgi:chondroitin 4-sulfotransferase 11
MHALRSDIENKNHILYADRHYPIEHYKNSCPVEYGRYFKFGFVRNPWDRLYSQYRYLRFTAKFDHAQCAFSTWIERCADALETSDEYLFGRNRKNFELHMMSQYRWLSIDGVQAVDYIGRFENIQDDFDLVARKLGANLLLPHENKGVAGLNYRDAYNDKIIDIVRMLSTEDIEKFGYSF